MVEQSRNYAQSLQKPATLDHIIPGPDYIPPENLKYENDNEHLVDKHERLTKELDEALKAKRKAKQFRISAHETNWVGANENPFYANKNPEHLRTENYSNNQNNIFNKSQAKSDSQSKLDAYKGSILKGKEKNQYSTPNL